MRNRRHFNGINEMDIQDVALEDIVDLEELQLLFEKFSKATGYTTGLVDHTSGKVLVGTGWRDICVKFHRSCPESEQYCLDSNKALTADLNQPGEIRIHHCKHGLVDGSTPIIIQGKHFANLFTGQILFAPPDQEQFKTQARQYGFDEQKYLDCLAKVPIVSEESFTDMMEYLAQTASLITKMGLSKLETQESLKNKGALLESVFTSAPMGIGIVVDRVLQWTNQRLCEMTGFTSDELTGQSARMLYASDEEFQRVGDEKYNQIKSHGTGTINTYFQRKDGSLIAIHLSSTPLDPQHLSTGVTFTALDITDLEKANTAIQTNETRLQLALEGANLGLWDWDLQTNTVYFNPRYLSMLGYGPTELPHDFSTFENLLHPDDKETILKKITTIIHQDAGQWNQRFRLQCKTGEYLWILARGKVVEHDQDGTPLRATGTHLDITAAKAAEVALQESEKRFRELFNNMGSGVAIYETLDNGSRFTITDLNSAALNSSQLVHQEVIGKDVEEIFPGIAEMGLLAVMRRVWQTGVAEYHPCSEYSDDRISLWVENYVCKLPSGEIVAIYDDITKRKLAENQLLKAKEEWALTFDAMPDIVTIQDKDMRIIRANKAAYEFFEAKPGDLTGKYCYEIFTNNTFPCEECPLLSTIEDVNIHSKIMRNDYLDKIFHVSSSAITDENGELQYLVHASKDITKQTKLEEELFQAHKMEAIGTLAGGIAHDFNNILAAIIGFSELARETIPPGCSAITDIDQVLKSGNRAAELVQQILTFSRKGGEHDLHAIKPHLVIKEALSMLHSTLPSTLSLQENIDHHCGSILANPTHLHQIVINLCTNAFHAMENEKGVLGVSLKRVELNPQDISAENIQPGSFIQLSCSDTGHGMDQKTIERIFDPYFTSKEVGKGTGLGLAVTHGIIQDHKGFIKVESEPGKGSTFHVYFPALKEEVVTPLSERKKEAPPTGSERILIVDDELSIVELHKTMLERLGYTVTTAVNGSDALETFRLHSDEFDLLITDQTMPNLSGGELAAEVLKIKPTLPIILCTGYSTVLSKEKALAIGIKKYITKPVQMAPLAKMVREVLDEG